MTARQSRGDPDTLDGQRPGEFEDLGKGPPPVYKMDKDDWEHRETYCPDGPAQVPLSGNPARGYGAEPLEEVKFLYNTRAIKESESCHFSSQPNVHNFRQWWLNMKKGVAKASGEPDEGYA